MQVRFRPFAQGHSLALSGLDAVLREDDGPDVGQETCGEADLLALASRGRPGGGEECLAGGTSVDLARLSATTFKDSLRTASLRHNPRAFPPEEPGRFWHAGAAEAQTETRHDHAALGKSRTCQRIPAQNTRTPHHILNFHMKNHCFPAEVRRRILPVERTFHKARQPMQLQVSSPTHIFTAEDRHA